MEAKTQNGYLVVADISGYTSYLARTELEHAQEVLSELLELVVSRLTPPLTLAGLGGDAVFVYAAQSRLPRGELLLELIESTYVAFKDRVEAVRRRTTCTCNACRAISSLDLKFVAHAGAYGVQTIAGRSELVGADVTLLHRLLKNHVVEATGWHGYALFTEECLARLETQPEGMHQQKEQYEYLGDVTTYSLNLNAYYRTRRETRHIVVTPEAALATVAVEIPAPPPVVWEWLSDPHKRSQYAGDGNEFVVVTRLGGRTGAGTRNHCLHGKKVGMVEDVLDWRPFDYLTVQMQTHGMTIVETDQLEPLPSGGTRLSIFLDGATPLPGFLRRPLLTLFATFIYSKVIERAKQLIIEEQAQEDTALATIQVESSAPVVAAASQA